MISSKTKWMAGGLALATIGFCGIVADGETPASRPPAFKPVMPLESLMEEQARHFDNVIDLLRDADVPEWENKLRHEALALAEMANVNGYQPKAFEHDDYRDWAGQLKKQAIELAALANKDKVADAKALVKKINKTCKTCHNKYED